MPGEGRVRTREGVAGVVLGLDLVGRMVCASREVSSYPLLALLIRHNKAPSAEPQSSPSLQLPLGPFHSDNANPPATLAVLRPESHPSRRSLSKSPKNASCKRGH